MKLPGRTISERLYESRQHFSCNIDFVVLSVDRERRFERHHGVGKAINGNDPAFWETHPFKLEGGSPALVCCP